MEKIVRSLLRWGASLPIIMKGGIAEKILNRLLLYYRKKNVADSVIYSNLGINNSIKIGLPILQAPATFFFGIPQSYTGEYYTIKLTSMLAKHCASFIDIGANWGFFSYYISHYYPSLSVYWFEPNTILNKNIVFNINNSHIINMHGSTQAISDSNGTISFYVENGAGFNSSLIKPIAGNLTEVTVEAIRFDDWVNKNNIGGNLLVKVDVENAEWHFIKGAIKELDKIEFLIMEVLGPARQSGFINYMIQDLKLNAYYINEDKVEHVLQEDMRYTKGEFNWLFCRYNPIALKEKLNNTFFTLVA